MTEVGSWLISNQKQITYILCFLFLSFRVPKDQGVNQDLLWVHLCLYLFAINIQLPGFEIFTSWVLVCFILFFEYVTGSTWSTWSKSKLSWLVSFCFVSAYQLWGRRLWVCGCVCERGLWVVCMCVCVICICVVCMYVCVLYVCIIVCACVCVVCDYCMCVVCMCCGVGGGKEGRQLSFFYYLSYSFETGSLTRSRLVTSTTLSPQLGFASLLKHTCILMWGLWLTRSYAWLPSALLHWAVSPPPSCEL